MEKRIVKRYSIAFKKEVVREYEAGATVGELNRKYAITGTETVKSWVKRYSREGLRHKLMIIQKPEEQQRVKELEGQISELEKLVAQLSMDKFMLERSLALAEAELGYAVKKKSATNSSSRPKKQRLKGVKK